MSLSPGLKSHNATGSNHVGDYSKGGISLSGECLRMLQIFDSPTFLTNVGKNRGLPMPFATFSNFQRYLATISNILANVCTSVCIFNFSNNSISWYYLKGKVPKKINSQRLEDTQVGYISQKYTLENYTLKNTIWLQKAFSSKTTVAQKCQGAMEIHEYHFAKTHLRKYTFGKYTFEK